MILGTQNLINAAWAISLFLVEVKTRSSYAPPPLITFEKSHRLNDQHAPRIEQNLIWKRLWTTICYMRFQKRVSRNVMLNWLSEDKISRLASKLFLNEFIREIFLPSQKNLRSLAGTCISIIAKHVATATNQLQFYKKNFFPDLLNSSEPICFKFWKWKSNWEN